MVRGCRRPRHIRGRGPLETSSRGARTKDSVGGMKWSARERAERNLADHLTALRGWTYRFFASLRMTEIPGQAGNDGELVGDIGVLQFKAGDMAKFLVDFYGIEGETL